MGSRAVTSLVSRQRHAPQERSDEEQSSSRKAAQGDDRHGEAERSGAPFRPRASGEESFLLLEAGERSARFLTGPKWCPTEL